MSDSPQLFSGCLFLLGRGYLRFYLLNLCAGSLSGRGVESLLLGHLEQLILELLVGIPDLLQGLPQLGVGGFADNGGIGGQTAFHARQHVIYHFFILHMSGH